MTREEAWVLVREKIKSEFTLNHLLASEAVMRALASRFNEDQDSWGIAGLVHDIDWEITAHNPEQHSLLGAVWLREAGLSDHIVQAVKTHNHLHQLKPESLMAKALYCSEELTGLIVACALVQPDKKLASVKVSSVKKKFKDKSFAAGVNRDIILTCRELIGLTLDELIELELIALQAIASSIAL